MAKLQAKKQEEVKEEVQGTVTVTYPYKGKAPVFGYGNVTVQGVPIFINNFNLVDGTDDYDAFVSAPQTQYTDKEGNKKYTSVAGPASKETKVLLDEAATECFVKMEETGETTMESFVASNGLKITYPRMNPIQGNEKILLSFGINTEGVDEAFFISNLVVRERDDGTKWTAFPQRPYQVDGETKYSALAGPASKEARIAIEEALIQTISEI